MHWTAYGWGMGFGWVFMLVFWAIVFFGIITLVRILSKGSKAEKGIETPLEILKLRYAKGEITKEEFERMKDDLKKD